MTPAIRETRSGLRFNPGEAQGLWPLRWCVHLLPSCGVNHLPSAGAGSEDPFKAVYPTEVQGLLLSIEQALTR